MSERNENGQRHTGHMQKCFQKQWRGAGKRIYTKVDRINPAKREKSDNYHSEADMKAGIYCRLSEEDKDKQSADDDSCSIQNQKSMLVQYALEQGWEIYRIYSDDDYAGADRNRPEFNRLIADARQRKLDIVLCKTQSRFTRELELVEKYIHGLFPLWGIRFVSIVDHADTADRGNKKSRQINGLVNEWYLEDMSENIRSVLTNRRKNGFHIGSSALYGYKKDPVQKGHLLIDEEAAQVVREIFTLFSQGYGKTAIARLLNSRNIPSPSEYKRLHGFQFQKPKSPASALWKYSAVSHILANEIYIGNMVQGRYGSVSYKTKQNRPRPKELWYVVEGTHEPIIDQELWTKVQTLISQKSRPFTTGEMGLFARKARCSSCGCILRSNKQSDGRRYLRCPSRYISKEACEGSFISVLSLEQAVTAQLKQLSAQYLNQGKIEKEIVSSRDDSAEQKRLEKDIAACKKKASEYEEGIQNLYLDKVKSLISENQFIEFSEKFSQEKERLEKHIENDKKQLAAIQKNIQEEDQKRLPIEQYINPEKLDREMVETLIDHITVGKRIPHTRKVPVEIHWNF